MQIIDNNWFVLNGRTSLYVKIDYTSYKVNTSIYLYSTNLLQKNIESINDDLVDKIITIDGDIYTSVEKIYENITDLPCTLSYNIDNVGYIRVIYENKNSMRFISDEFNIDINDNFAFGKNRIFMKLLHRHSNLLYIFTESCIIYNLISMDKKFKKKKGCTEYVKTII